MPRNGVLPHFQLSRTFIPACFGRYRGMAFFGVGESRLLQFSNHVNKFFAI
jgi:hypothetical protein